MNTASIGPIESDRPMHSFNARNQPTPEHAPAPPLRALIILVLGLLAAWLAAGSLGWLAPPLQKALTWLALATIVIAALAGRRRISAHIDGLLLGGATLIAVLMTASSLPVVNILAVAILLAAVAQVRPGSTAQVVRPCRLGCHGAGRFPARLRWLGRRLDLHQQRGPRRGALGRLADGPAAADWRELRRPRLPGAHGGPDRRLAHRHAATARSAAPHGPCCSSPCADRLSRGSGLQPRPDRTAAAANDAQVR